MKRKFAICLLIIFFISLAAASAADSADAEDSQLHETDDVQLDSAADSSSANLTVNEKLSSSNEDALGTESPETNFTFKALKSSMDAGSGTFTFRADCVAESSDWSYSGAVASTGIDVSQYSLIDGNGHSIDLGNFNYGRVFNINQVSSITIKNLTFKNAGANSISGGAVNIYNSTVTFENCKFINNKAINGSSIYCDM